MGNSDIYDFVDYTNPKNSELLKNTKNSQMNDLQSNNSFPETKPSSNLSSEIFKDADINKYTPTYSKNNSRP